MSSESLDDSRALVTLEMQALQATVDRFDGAAAAALGVHRTDLQCLEILVTRGPATAGALAAALDLTTGGVTAMLVRLERQGHLTRAPDPADGRRVIVQVAPDSRDRLWELYEPIATEGADLIACYSSSELDLLARFLGDARQLYERHLRR